MAAPAVAPPSSLSSLSPLGTAVRNGITPRESSEQPAVRDAERMRKSYRELLLREVTQCDQGLQQLAEGLFIGSLGGAVSSSALAAHGVSHVMCIATNVSESALRRKAPGLEVSVTKLRDSCSEAGAFLQALPALLAFAASATENGGNVLVCSFRGRSRAAAVAVAQLMLLAGLSLRDAVTRVARARPGAAPNPGFARALVALEAAVAADCLGEGCGEEQMHSLHAVVTAALEALPGLQAEGSPPRSLDLGGGDSLALPEGLDDLSDDAVFEEGAALAARFGGEAAAAFHAEDDGAACFGGSFAAQVLAPPLAAAPLPAPPAPPTPEIDIEAELAALEVAKAEAVAREDFAEAGRLRDVKRILLERIEAVHEAAASKGSSDASAQDAEEARRREDAYEQLQAQHEELMEQKRRSVEAENYEEAAEVRDALRSVEADLEQLRQMGAGGDSALVVLPNGVKSLVKAQSFEFTLDYHDDWQKDFVRLAEEKANSVGITRSKFRSDFLDVTDSRGARLTPADGEPRQEQFPLLVRYVLPPDASVEARASDVRRPAADVSIADVTQDRNVATKNTRAERLRELLGQIEDDGSANGRAGGDKDKDRNVERLGKLLDALKDMQREGGQLNVAGGEGQGGKPGASSALSPTRLTMLQKFFVYPVVLVLVLLTLMVLHAILLRAALWLLQDGGTMEAS